MHPIKSVEARIQSYTLNHFEKTKYAERLRQFKDIHRGESCFIIGNGPSLRPEDLQILHENKVVTFGTNRVFKIFDKTDWRPEYYVCEDIILIEGITKEVNKIESETKFIPIQLKFFNDIVIDKAVYFKMLYDEPSISIDAAKGVYCRGTVTVTCLQLAIYMGFSKIYLLGVDHNFAKMTDKNGNVFIDKSIVNHFSNDYDNDIIDQGFAIDSATEAYLDVEKLSKTLGSFRVYNATRGGKLEVFERADFDKVIKEI